VPILYILIKTASDRFFPPRATPDLDELEAPLPSQKVSP